MGAQTPGVSAGEGSSERLRVLHVDDEPGYGEVLGEFLTRADDALAVVVETDPRAALERIRGGGIDCVVSDYDMPGMNGLGLLKAIRECDETIPFILYTGNGDESVASDAISAGVTDYLQKRDIADQSPVLATRICKAIEKDRAEAKGQRRSSALRAAREGIALFDDEGRITFANDAYVDLYGYEREALVGSHWTRLHPEATVERIESDVLPAVADAGEWSGESTGRRADGSTFPDKKTVARLDDGGFVVVVTDLTACDGRCDRAEGDAAALREAVATANDRLAAHWEASSGRRVGTDADAALADVERALASAASILGIDDAARPEDESAPSARESTPSGDEAIPR